jgi:alanyl-tRNA synthetase
MKTFREYYEDKEHEKLEEDIASAAVIGLFALPATLAAAWGASWITYRYGKMTKALVQRVVKTWSQIKQLFKKNDEEVETAVDKTVEKVSQDPKVRQAVREVEKLKDKYADNLQELYKAIEDKDQDAAKEAYQKLESKYQNNPEVRTALVDKIMEVYRQPPIYVSSPGNETYQMIKKVLGQKTAAGLEELAKQGFMDYYKKTEASEEEEEE